jgi:hypothetical protein
MIKFSLDQLNFESLINLIVDYTEVLLSCIVIMLLSILNEWFRRFRVIYLKDKMQVTNEEMLPIANHIHVENRLQQPCSGTNTNVESSHEEYASEKQPSSFALDMVSRLILTLMFMIQILINYCLMLIAMTMNIVYFSSVVIGLMLGYFLFGHQ